MEVLKSLAQWFFLDSIYGGVLVAAAVYAFAKLVKAKLPGAPRPEVSTGVAIVLCFLLLPAIPRFHFEYQTLDKLEGADWFRVTNKTHAGAVWLPVTWIKVPLYSITVVMPELIEADSFRLLRLTFDEEPYEAAITAWCDDSDIWIAEPDNEGTFRYAETRAMREDERHLYCQSDWSNEKEALYVELAGQKR